MTQQEVYDKLLPLKPAELSLCISYQIATFGTFYTLCMAHNDVTRGFSVSHLDPNEVFALSLEALAKIYREDKP
jgi:hypothetical protein